MDIRSGMIVRSGAGRDKGKFLVVIGTDEEFAYLADGKERKLLKPKKKRLKHIFPTKTVIETADLTDKMLRNVIRDFTGNDL